MGGVKVCAPPPRNGRNCRGAANFPNANAISVSLLRSGADWMEGERMSSRKRKTAAASVRLCVGGRFWHSRPCATLEGLDDYPIGAHKKQRGRGYSVG
jgi:hypothetical protein